MIQQHRIEEEWNIIKYYKLILTIIIIKKSQKQVPDAD